MPRISGQPTASFAGTCSAGPDRLARRVALLDAPCARALDLRGGERVLAVGTGIPGFARAIARAAPEVGVTGIAPGDGRPGSGTEREPSLRAGDAHALPLGPEEWGTFDLAVARCALSRSEVPERIVAGLARAVRPGGRVVLIEDDRAQLRWRPEVAGLERVWPAACRALDAVGVGRPLPDLLRDAGLIAPRRGGFRFGGAAGEAGFELLIRDLVELLDGARDRIVAYGGVEAGAIDATIGHLDAWRDRPGATLSSGASVAEARRPTGAGFTLTP